MEAVLCEDPLETETEKPDERSEQEVEFKDELGWSMDKKILADIVKREAKVTVRVRRKKNTNNTEPGQVF